VIEWVSLSLSVAQSQHFLTSTNKYVFQLGVKNIFLSFKINFFRLEESNRMQTKQTTFFKNKLLL